MEKITRRNFLKTTSLGLIGLQSKIFGLPFYKKKPNIIILFADDMGYGDATCYGHPTINTPNIDAMAEDGIKMTSFYVTAPTCTPSRASLLTGRYPMRSGLPAVLNPKSTHGLPESEVTLAELFNNKGYKTKCVGKWHLGHADEKYLPTNHGFDSYYGLLYSNDMTEEVYDTPIKLYRDTQPIESPVNQSTLTKRYTREAVDFIQSSKEQFFLYLPYTMPHLPLHASEKFEGKSRAGQYGDVIEEIDWSVGEILQTLKEEGIEKETLIFFSSDNGPACRMYPGMANGYKGKSTGSPGLLRGKKGTTYEGGMRVPGIFKWPENIPEQQSSSELATTLDIFPTFLKAADINIPQNIKLDGDDILPLLKGEVKKLPERDFYYFNHENLEAIRSGKWKFRLAMDSKNRSEFESSVPELFNLEVDPREQYNIAQKHPDKILVMYDKMKNFAVQLDGQVLGQFYPVKIEVSPINNIVFEVSMQPMFDYFDVQYSLDGKKYQQYSKPFKIERPQLISAKAIYKNEQIGKTSSMDINLAYNRSVNYKNKYHSKYTGGGKHGLVNGKFGLINYKDNNWQGFEKDDLEIVINLDKVTDISQVEVNCLQATGAWIWLPQSVNVFISEKGEDFTPVKRIKNEIPIDRQGSFVHNFKINFTKNESAQYVKIRAKNLATCPEWHPGADGPAWIFCDEIIIK